MWTDILISAALAILTIVMAYLGVHVTLHPADSTRAKRWYKIGFSSCAMVAVALVVWQGVRNGEAQAGFQRTVENAAQSAQRASQRIDGLQRDEQTEIARREQAERDLAIIVQGTGKSTREGVVDDIKKSPIKVELNGAQPETAPLQSEDVRIVSSVERSIYPDAPYAASWIIQPNVPITGSFRRIISCASAIKYIEDHLTGAGIISVGKGSKDTGKMVPEVRIDEGDKTKIIIDMSAVPGIPLLTPEHSYIVHVYSDVGAVIIKKIELGPK